MKTILVTEATWEMLQEIKYRERRKSIEKVILSRLEHAGDGKSPLQDSP